MLSQDLFNPHKSKRMGHTFSTLASRLKKIGHRFTALYRGPWYKKTLMWLLTCIISVILLLVAVDVNFLYLFGKSPGFKDIKHPVTSEASEIYSADSILIGRFFSENRTPVEYGDI